MKNAFELPELTVVILEKKDVIATSLAASPAPFVGEEDTFDSGVLL